MSPTSKRGGDSDAQQPAASASAANAHKNAPGLDCLGCRMVGFAFGAGGGGYIMYQLMNMPPPTTSHKYAMVATACTMFAFGMYRALW